MKGRDGRTKKAKRNSKSIRYYFMIWGVIHKQVSHRVRKETLNRMSKGIGDGTKQIYVHKNIGFAFRDSYAGECSYFSDRSSSPEVIFQGHIYNSAELKKSLDGNPDISNSAQLFARLHDRWGEACVEHIRGKFAFVLYDRRNSLAILGRDRLGIEPLFYSEDDERIVFGSSVFPVVQYPDFRKELNLLSIQQYLFYCYNPSVDTFFKRVKKLRPGHVLIHRKDSSKIKQYWKLSFADITTENELKITEKLLELLRESVRIRCEDHRTPGVFVSGGLDSSTVLALSKEAVDQPIYTFSYRCAGESFDESPYAKLVSEYYGARHTLIEYPSDAVETVQELVRYMNEPFCDVGINIATDILGKASQGNASYVLTGDGGDELFGGHPVYLADRWGRVMDRVPVFVRNPFLWAGSKLGDSDKKKDFRVKWKRFSVSMRYPQTLLSHRWRIYYSPNELPMLFNPDIHPHLNTIDPYNTILTINAEADGDTFLDKALYSDYQTVTGFYLRRMDLIRRYGIESRFPMLDHRLVEFGATIPAHLKIRKGADQKYILKQTMKDILPPEIVFRKDKLGHSIPLKNWMRDDPKVRNFMTELLSEESLKKRGMFESQTVFKYIEEHLSKKHNHSHRLWALMVLELWMREHMDQ